MEGQGGLGQFKEPVQSQTGPTPHTSNSPGPSAPPADPFFPLLRPRQTELRMPVQPLQPTGPCVPSGARTGALPNVGNPNTKTATPLTAPRGL